MLFIENNKKYPTLILSRVLVLDRRYSSSELLGALHNSSLLETVTTDVTVELEMESIDFRPEGAILRLNVY